MSSNTILTIEAGSMQSIGVVTLEAVNNDIDEGDKRVMVTGEAVNELGMTGPEKVMLEIRDDDAQARRVKEKVLKVPLAPPPPMVTATPGSQNSIDVSWSAPPNTGRPDIQHYNLQYRQGESGNWTDGPQDVNGMTATIAGLVPATVYQVRVRAVNADGDGAWSQPGTGCTAKVPLAPPPPMVTATPGSRKSLDVSWTAPPNTGRPDIQHYDLQYRQGAGGNWTAGPQDENGMTATIAGLVP